MTSPHGPGRLSRRGLLRTGTLTAGALAFATAVSPWAAQAQETDAADGPLWLRYREPADPDLLAQYRAAFKRVAVFGDDPLIANAENEVRRALTGLTGTAPASGGPGAYGTLVIGTADASPHLRIEDPEALGAEGFAIRVQRAGHRVKRVTVAANAPAGVLYGVFHLIRLLQNGTAPADLTATEAPDTRLRMLNHWDNRDGSVERGYAGRSLFDWDALPELSERMTDYARLTASIGINAAVLNNVNADAAFIEAPMLAKLAPLCAMLATWGISPWLSLNYASPIVLTADDADPITTADPEDPRVQDWWAAKIAEVKAAIPALGGFLVKANSEGRPGPLDYGRTHADGANMLARAVAPHDGLIVWRSFVHEDFGDWAEYQHRVFAPLDGEFDDNVIVQTKNGPIDFQVREPVHPCSAPSIAPTRWPNSRSPRSTPARPGTRCSSLRCGAKSSTSPRAGPEPVPPSRRSCPPTAPDSRASPISGTPRTGPATTSGPRTATPSDGSPGPPAPTRATSPPSGPA
nr:hypothetical protein GCM10025732_33760 [Glycomyces mayteni]